MYKKIIIMIFVIILNMCTVNAQEANDVVYSLIRPIYQNATISRGDCVATLMRIVGVTDTLAQRKATALYDQPHFEDLGIDLNSGYIRAAKEGGVAEGVNPGMIVGDFCADRKVTIKECLTFMLRCLKSSSTVKWENVIDDSLYIGLLTDAEYGDLNEDELLTVSRFEIFLERMLNMNRCLYWPEERPEPGYAKSFKRDDSGQIKYIDWIRNRVIDNEW